MAKERGTMRCPFCGGKTKVLDSRSDKSYNHVRRRRECIAPACGVRFTTIEVATIISQSAKPLLEWASGEK